MEMISLIERNMLITGVLVASPNLFIIFLFPSRKYFLIEIKNDDFSIRETQHNIIRLFERKSLIVSERNVEFFSFFCSNSLEMICKWPFKC